MTSCLMVTDQEIEALFYLPKDSAIAAYLGISEERVAKIRGKRKRSHKPKPVIAEKPVIEPEIIKALEEPLPPVSRESVLTPTLCPACGAPVSGRLMVTHIQALVAAYYKVPFREMTSDRRHREVAWPRQVAMYLAYENTPKSLPEIGIRFGGRDHTTVIHAIKRVQSRMLADAEIECDIVALRERLAA